MFFNTCVSLCTKCTVNTASHAYRISNNMFINEVILICIVVTACTGKIHIPSIYDNHTTGKEELLKYTFKTEFRYRPGKHIYYFYQGFSFLSFVVFVDTASDEIHFWKGAVSKKIIYANIP